MDLTTLYQCVTSFRFFEPANAQIVINDVGSFNTAQFNTALLKNLNCTFVHYEPAAGIYQIRIKGTDDIIEISEDQIKIIKNSLNQVVVDFDIAFPCYDANKIYKGNLSISDILKYNYTAANTKCEYAVGRYNEETAIWEEIYAIILDDGQLILNPAGTCDKCVLFFTKTEWDNFVQPPENNLLIHVRYDFENQCWINILTYAECIREYYQNVKVSIVNKKLLLKQKFDPQNALELTDKSNIFQTDDVKISVNQLLSITNTISAKLNIVIDRNTIDTEMSTFVDRTKLITEGLAELNGLLEILLILPDTLPDNNRTKDTISELSDYVLEYIEIFYQNLIS